MNVSLSLNGLGEMPLVPIADLNGTKKYTAEEVECRNKLAALYRLIDHFRWSQSIYNHITLRLPGSDNEILINPLGMLYREVTASSFAKISVDGRVIDSGSTPLGINQAGYVLHSAIHGARHDVKCVLHLHTASAAAVSAMKCGLLPIIQEAMILGPVAYHEYRGILTDVQERKEIVKSLGDKKVLMLRNHGFATCGATIEEAFHLAYETIVACETQVAAMRTDLKKNLVLPKESAVAHAYQIAKHGTNGMNRTAVPELNGKMEHTFERMGNIQWGVGELEWEAWMRQLDGAGYQTGHKYRLPILLEPMTKKK
ncbi:hypothetical protein niasHT_033708 [Heterodera trifolii]|uniref:Class II aldolase/adducin N-terminal domain-containing protein n=1 Tax=Heterodera trifolii TaxID=157864 RepID=A0ABD2IJ64_9BILA